MKKSFLKTLSILFFLFLATSVMAQKGLNEEKTPLGNLQGNGTPLLIKNQEIRNITRNLTQQIKEQRIELREILKNYSNLSLEEREQVREEVRNQIKFLRDNLTKLKSELDKEIEGLNEQERIRVENNNKVRLAVHAFLAMENLTGGIGKNVSEIARNFNNSIQSTLRHEEKLKNRNKVLRFLFGSDLKTVKQIENETLRLQEMISKINESINNCTECTEEVKEMLQEQLMLMQQEQQRLQQSVQKEKKITGIFGWILRRK
ncbi:MAG: hypothetical protein ACP5OZ_01955 [Candidatus Woesearchaeota archaeon]